MTRLTKISACCGLALGLVSACHKANESESAAGRVQNEQADLRTQLEAKTQKAAEGVQDLAREANDVAVAQQAFEAEREARVDVLRALHGLYAGHPMLLSTVTANEPLTDASRAEVVEKLTILELRLDEAAKAVEGLQTVGAEDWKARNDAASAAVQRMTEADKAAFAAFRDAARLPRRAS